MNPHCSTALRPQRELVPSAPRHLWKSQLQKFETSSLHILRCFVWKYAHDIQLPSKKKTQHRHVNSWSSFSPWFSPCFPMVFPFVHHFSPQNSGGFWDPTWSKSRCQAEASQPHLGTAISPAVRLAMTGQWPMASFSIPQDLVKSCHRAGAHTCGLWQRFFSRIKDGRTWMDDPFGSFLFRRGLETKKQMDDFLGVSPEVSRWTPE